MKTDLNMKTVAPAPFPFRARNLPYYLLLFVLWLVSVILCGWVANTLVNACGCFLNV